MAGADGRADAQIRIRLWDLPTRLTHWLIAGLVAFSWFTAETDRMTLHRWSGYAILGLVVFRIYWGFAGGSTVRFASFVKGPRATWGYAKTLGRRAPADLPGHNPLGAWSVLAMLAAMALQVGLGLFAVDVDGFESGPLSFLVDFETGRQFAEWHELTFNVLLGLIVLHLAAVLFYLVYKRQDLITAMLTGRRALAGQPGRITFAPAWRALVGAALAAAIAWAVANGLWL